MRSAHLVATALALVGLFALASCAPALCTTSCGLTSNDVECGELATAEASIVKTYSVWLGKPEAEICVALSGWEVRVYSPEDGALRAEGFTSCPCIDGAECFCPPLVQRAERGLTDWFQRRLILSYRPESTGENYFSQMLLSYALPHESMHVVLADGSDCAEWKGTSRQAAIDVVENEVQRSERLTGATTP